MKVLIYLTKDKMEAEQPTDAKPIAILTDTRNTLNLVAVHPDYKSFILELISDPIMDLQTGKYITAKDNPTRWLQMFALRGTNLLLSIETVGEIKKINIKG